eukprot:gene9956-20700_t
MGENANANWEWHNKEVGTGYQAKGVVRQRSAQPNEFKIVDLSCNVDKAEKRKHTEIHDNIVESDKKAKKSHNDKDSKKKKHKKDKKTDKKKDKKSKEHKRERNDFNPLLQLLVTRLSNKTRSFSPTNSSR